MFQMGPFGTEALMLERILSRRMEERLRRLTERLADPPRQPRQRLRDADVAKLYGHRRYDNVRVGREAGWLPPHA